MKLKLEIDIQDLINSMFEEATVDSDGCIDYDYDLKEDIIHDIKQSVKNNVISSISDKCIKTATEQTKHLIQEEYRFRSVK